MLNKLVESDRAACEQELERVQVVENNLKQEYNEAADHHFSKHRVVINACLIFDDKSR